MIRQLHGADAPAVAAVHLSELRTFWRGLSSQHLLACRYRAIAREKGAAGYVLLSGDEEVLGFVCGVWSAGELRRSLLLNEWPRLAFWGMACMLSNPGVLARLARQARRQAGQSPQAAGCLSEWTGYELRPIAVLPAARGTGVAKALVARLLQDARERSYKEVFLSTERDNTRANSFYLRCGFSLQGCVGGYNYYAIQL